MFSISKMCLAREESEDYALNNLPYLESKGKDNNLEVWSFRPCMVSIKEAARKGIKLETGKKTQVKLEPHGVDDEDPVLKLFNLYGPNTNPFQEGNESPSFLMARTLEDLRDFAEECWRNVDLFSSTSSLVRVLRNLQKVCVKAEIKGDFRRTLEALKILMPETEIKIRGTADLSRFMDNLCNEITSGQTDAPEIPIDLRYLIVRLTYGSGRGDHMPACFLHQFIRYTMPIKAYVDSSVADHSGSSIEDVAYLPIDQLGKIPKYRTMCLAKVSSRSTTYGSNKDVLVCRILPKEDGGIKLSLGCGGAENDRQRNRHNILSLYEIEAELREQTIKYEKTEKPIDGTGRSGYSPKIIVDVDELSTEMCHRAPFTLEKLDPKITYSTIQATVTTSNRDASYDETQFALTTLSTGRWSPTGSMNADSMDKAAQAFGTDLSFVRKREAKTERLGEKAWGAYQEAEKALPGIFADFYKPGISLIVPRDLPSADHTHDMITLPRGRALFKGYKKSRAEKIEFLSKNKDTGAIGSMAQNMELGKWIGPWSCLDRIFPHSVGGICQLIYLPSLKQQGGQCAQGGAWDLDLMPISPLSLIWARLAKLLIDNRAMAAPLCNCGKVKKKDEWVNLGEYNSKIPAGCDICGTFKSVIYSLLNAFVFSRTVRGSYLEWWQEGQNLLDMELVMKDLFDPEKSMVSAIPSPMQLITHRGAIINDPELGKYRGESCPND